MARGGESCRRRGARHGVWGDLALRVSLSRILGEEEGISHSWLAGTLCVDCAERRKTDSSIEVWPGRFHLALFCELTSSSSILRF